MSAGRWLAVGLGVVVLVCAGLTMVGSNLPPETYEVKACGLRFTTNHWFDHKEIEPGTAELRGPMGRVVAGCVPADMTLEAYHETSRQAIAAMSKGTIGSSRAVTIDGHPGLRSAFDIPGEGYAEGHVLTMHTGQQIVEIRVQLRPLRDTWWERLFESIDLD